LMTGHTPNHFFAILNHLDFYDIDIGMELSGKEQKKVAEDEDMEELQKLLLSGPIMSDGQYKDFQELRKSFANWLESK
jgi:hypothetical protein